MSYRVRTPEGEMEFASLYEISNALRHGLVDGDDELLVPGADHLGAGRRPLGAEGPRPAAVPALRPGSVLGGLELGATLASALVAVTGILSGWNYWVVGGCGPGRGVAVDPAGAPLGAGPLGQPGRLPASMSRRLLLLGRRCCSPAAAAARADDVYVWTDASGETHYTNDVGEHPREVASHRPEAGERSAEAVAPQRRSPVISRRRPAQGDGAAEGRGRLPSSPRRRSRSRTDHPRAARRREGQRGAVAHDVPQGQRAGARGPSGKTQRTRDALSKLPGQDFTSYDYAGNLVVDSRYQALKLQLEEDEYQLNDAREELHDLERAAAREAIPLEWRR